MPKKEYRLSLTKRGQFDWEGVYSVVEVSAKSAFLGHPTEVPICRSHKTEVARQRIFAEAAADAPIFAKESSGLEAWPRANMDARPGRKRVNR
jgi:hypothetical protein